jgi:hypothetical protein
MRRREVIALLALSASHGAAPFPRSDWHPLLPRNVRGDAAAAEAAARALERDDKVELGMAPRLADCGFASAPIPSRPCLAPASRLLKAPSVRLGEFAARRATPACSEPSSGVQATRVPSA